MDKPQVMVPGLRKRHRLIWTLFSVLLPVVFIAAVVNIPQTVLEETLPEPLPEAYPDLIQSTDTDLFLLNLRENSAGQRQIEIMIKGVLITPSASVYLADQENADVSVSKLVGNMGTSGVCRFPLNYPESTSRERYIRIQEVVKGTEILEWTKVN